MRRRLLRFVLEVVFRPWSRRKTTRMQGICDAFLAWYAPESPTMTPILIGSCSSRRWLPVTSLNRAFICCGSRRRRRRRTLGVFFSDVSCVSHSRCTLDSSSALVASAAMSKTRSMSASSSDFPVRTRPEMHRRALHLSCFATRPRSKSNIQHEPQNPTTH